MPTDFARLQFQNDQGKVGLRAQDTGELVLDDVRVPDSNRLGDEGRGFKVAMSALDNGRISLAAGCVRDRAGLSRREHRVRERAQAIRQPDRPLPSGTGVDGRHRRRDGRGPVIRRGAPRPRPTPVKRHTPESSLAKYFASEVAVRGPTLRCRCTAVMATGRVPGR